MRILIIEDETNFANGLAMYLRREGYAVDVAATGEKGYELAVTNVYDVLLLDLNLPGMDGIEVCRRLRLNNPKLLIMILTARGLPTDKVYGLDTGADDYMVKPFDLFELHARIRALLRRGQQVRDVVIQWGKIKLDRVTKTVWYGKKRLELTHKEYSMLEYLMCHPGKVISAEEFLEHVWDARANCFTNSVKVHIHSLRQKLNEACNTSEIIETVIGQGYRLVNPTHEDEL